MQSDLQSGWTSNFLSARQRRIDTLNLFHVVYTRLCLLFGSNDLILAATDPAEFSDSLDVICRQFTLNILDVDCAAPSQSSKVSLDE